MNTITVIGNLTRDPELRFAANGNPSASFSIADTRSWKDRNGEWQEETSFFNCVMWGPAAENVANSINKGMRVIVAGRLKQRSYTADGGEKRSVVEIDVDEMGPSTRFHTIDGVSKVTRNNENGAAPATAAAAVTAATGDEVSEEPF